MRFLALLWTLTAVACAGGDDPAATDGADGGADGTDGADGSTADGADGTTADGTDGADGTDDDGGIDTADYGIPGDTPLPGSCGVDARWDGATPLFAEGTSAWGLDELGVVGIRVNAVDFDGDGWTDLVVRKGSGANDFAAGTRAMWLLRNTGEGRFEDVTEASGATHARDGVSGRAAHVWVWGDIDNDGDLDAWSGAQALDVASDNELVLNDGDGTFSNSDADNAARSHPASQYAASFLDYDRDGNLDLFVGSYADADSQPAQDRLYKGDGAGGFADVTEAAGLRTYGWGALYRLNDAEGHSRAWAAIACDLNNDHHPEILAASYGRSPNHLWQASGDGTYDNASIASNYAWDHRVDWTDNESARCWCTLHPDDDDCEGVPEPELIRCTTDSDAFRWSHTYDREPFRLGGNSGQTVCQDLDNDGWFDLLTSEIVHWDVGRSSDPSELLFNEGDADVRFLRPGNVWTGLERERELTDWNDGDITGTVFDFDNDCWNDVYIGSSDYPGTRGLLFHQEALRHFEPVPVELGIDHTRSHGVAVADFDRDGDLDVVVGHSTARCDDDCYDTAQLRLFENVHGQDHAWLQLQLVGGEGSNRAAIGARVDVTAGGVTQSRQVSGGGGQWGHQDDLLVHVGAGGQPTAEVTITWPDAAATTQTFTVDTSHRYRVEQGAEPVQVVLPAAD